MRSASDGDKLEFCKSRIRMEVPTTPPPKPQPTSPPQLNYGKVSDSAYEPDRVIRTLSFDDNMSPQSVFEIQVVCSVETRMLPVRRALFLANA